MRNVRFAVLLGLALFGTSALEAQAATDYCKGFGEGWKAIKGEGSLVPICPIEPVTPIGSTSYREGIRAGTGAARRAGGGRVGGVAPARSGGKFCDGFEEGWKVVKGELAIVPICPIEPITPVGSTPYREGLKAGMARGRG